MSALPYGFRILLFLVLVIVVVSFDFIKNGGNAKRWQEAIYIIGFATMGAMYGIIHDLFTSSISPEYFAIWKGLGFSEGFRGRVIILGFKAGFSAGATASCFLLYFNRPKTNIRTLSYKRLALLSIKPLILSLTGAIMLGIASTHVFPDAWFNYAKISLAEIQYRNFVNVWGIHLGSYAGLACGIVLGAIEISIRRKASDTTDTA